MTGILTAVWSWWNRTSLYPYGWHAYNAYYLNDMPTNSMKRINEYACALIQEIGRVIQNRQATSFLDDFLIDPRKYLILDDQPGWEVKVLFPPNLTECACLTGKFNRLTTNRRQAIETLMINTISETHEKSKKLRYLSLGVGGCLQDFINLGKLIQAGFENIEAVLVDTHIKHQIAKITPQMEILHAVAREKGIFLDIAYLASISEVTGRFQIIQCIDFDEMREVFFENKSLHVDEVFKAYHTMLKNSGRFYFSWDKYDLALEKGSLRTELVDGKRQLLFWSKTKRKHTCIQ